MAIRFLMGLFEAASMPEFALLSSQWYTVNEHNTRTGLHIKANGGGQIVGGLVGYGIARGIGVNGSALAGLSLAFIFTSIPDSQLNCRLLNKRDRLLSTKQVREKEQGIGNQHFKAPVSRGT
ncbi:hypothetical protein GQ53DRAFT_820404 [Thozetella sp. PMI_491]|nr:hypothetical protein GQ53DRAFT_820404 [Thozetella sp. PMI_491]